MAVDGEIGYNMHVGFSLLLVNDVVPGYCRFVAQSRVASTTTPEGRNTSISIASQSHMLTTSIRMHADPIAGIFHEYACVDLRVAPAKPSLVKTLMYRSCGICLLLSEQQWHDEFGSPH